MSATSPYRDYFRRRTIGRAASPPTWACYEQISYDDECSDSYSDSCSEDDEDYGRGGAADDDESDSDEEHVAPMRDGHVDDTNDIDMDMDGEVDAATAKKVVDAGKDVKGKQKAVDSNPTEHEPDNSDRRQRRRPQHVVRPLRPILTIHRSQGFVWNQVSRSWYRS
ncbi:hypothetical protein E1B28_011740 [Marasmius oreades]|uniref:Uncharacterized protein n=1 Tax=Marasmius oreades TaxID=181124 RepID=A0A9P7RUX7_9AGAR|nr:uncharacterized protein E1B28_011740 [Marasmius oreades]KAG7090132.1 hypothetical protein E1B28_011740 [Marasmius oreades]